MESLLRIWRCLLFLLRRNQMDQDLAQEMESHIEMKARANQQAGMGEKEAEQAARREFGNALLLKEVSLEMWGFCCIDSFLQDIRFGLRMLRKNPGFTGAVVLSLGLGIGANTSIFSLIDAVMLKMLPVSNPEELRLLSWVAQSLPGIMPANGIIHSLSGNLDQDRTGRSTCTSFSYPTFEHIHTRNDVFSKVFAFADPRRVNFNMNGQAQLADADLVSGDYFSGLGVGTVAGRTITEADDSAGAAPVAMISYGYWERRFGGEPSAVGRVVTVNNIPFTIIGVSPPEFFGLQAGRSIDVWLPLHAQPLVEPRWTEEGRSKFTRGDDWWVQIMGRLKPDVSEQLAGAAVEVAFQQSMATSQEATRSAASVKQSPGHRPPAPSQDLPHLELASASKGLNDLRQEFSKPLFILMGVVGLVLLIACANVANLLLSRTAAQQREIAVRLAIGAGRRRILRQLLTESVMLASLGGAFGLLLAYWATSVLIAFMSSGRNPITLSVRPNLNVLAFTTVISVVTGILFGLAPAYRITQVDLTGALKEAAGGSSSGLHHSRRKLGFGNALVVSQVAMALLLLVGAGLFVRTLQNLRNLNLGFDRRNILLFGIDPTQNGYKGDRLVNFYQELQRRIDALPGVHSASVSQNSLIGGGESIYGLSIPGYTSKDVSDGVHVNQVGPRFFETLGIPLALGRAIGPEDTSGAPKVAVINEMLAHRYFGSSNPVGRHAGWSGGDIEIVGVVANAKYADVRKEAPPTVYVAYAQYPERLQEMHFEVRTAGDSVAMISAIRRAVQDLDKSLPLFDVKTQVEQIDQTIFQERLFAKLSSFFGLLALTLTCVGLYGIMAYAVTRRTNEIGVRVALGADRRAIVGMVMRDVLVLVAIGIVIGTPVALASGRLISHMLFGLTSTDPLTIVVASLVMTAVAALAGYIPARRASNVHPMAALRYE